MTQTIYSGARRFGKSWAAATRLGMPMDEYRAMMRQRHERIEAARALMPPTPAPSFRTFYDECEHPSPWAVKWLNEAAGQPSDFAREYLCEFYPLPPEPMGPPSPTFEQWERNQKRKSLEAAGEPLPRWWRI